MFALILIIIIDLFILNGSLFMFRELGWNAIPEHGLLLVNIYYAITLLVFPPVAHRRFVRIEEVATRTFEMMLLYFVILGVHLLFIEGTTISFSQYLLIALCITFVLFWGRALSYSAIKGIRMSGRNSRNILFVGAGAHLLYLYERFNEFLGQGFRFMGYFNDGVSHHLPTEAKHLGDIVDVIPWLEKHIAENEKPNIIYCNLPRTRGDDIIALVHFCDQHFIQFYSTVNIGDYIHRVMCVKMIDDMPVMGLHTEALNRRHNRIVKRIFDLLISGLFLITCFWWIYIIVAIITKLTMPGPVFFTQKRNGIHGKEFRMIKFRSMKVNAEADTLQATKDDPRKTRWGEIMRKTNIDELPQFINVLLGDMSIVGPRPHMVLHTEMYSHLIDKYMIRHWVKPGITGWAQVNGARGETEELWQMEDRVKKDIWYIEHWSIWLDLRIILKTVTNIFQGDEQAY